MDSITQYRRYGYLATVNQNFIAATNWTVKALVEHGFQAPDCANLAFVAFNYCSRATIASLFDQLVDAGIRSRGSLHTTFLLLSFELELGADEPDRLVRRAYIEPCLAPRVIRRPSKPIVFWHIPKCSGTSLNSALGQRFYGSPASEVLPGYGYRPLVKFLMSEMLEEIPYFPSMHFGMDEISPTGDYFSFSVLRDPSRRCVSMYRQEAAVNAKGRANEANWHHYRAYPRYGAFWDYRKDKDFFRWLDNVPDWLLHRQLTTFSSGKDLHEATARVRKLDYLLGRDFHLGSEQTLFERLGLDYSADTVPTTLNRSDPSITVPDEAEEILRVRLAKEYQLINKISPATAAGTPDVVAQAHPPLS